MAQVLDITARKRAEEALSASEAKYRRLHESMMDAFVSISMDGFIQEYNEAYRKMLGYEPEEILKLHYMDVTPEKWHSFMAEIIQKQIILRGYSDVYEKEYRRKDGTIFPVEVRSFLIKDDHGQPCAIWGIIRDITERKQAEEALQKSHDELERKVAETRLNEARLEAMLQLSHMTEASLQEVTDFALEQAVALTMSKIGYLAFLNEDETILTMYSWSREAMAECAISDKPLAYPLKTTGLWGEAVRQRKPIVTNDYAAPNPLKKGLPEGHVRLGRHMNVPIFDGGHIIIVAGVGNKDEDYDESDVRQLMLLMDGMWILIQRQRVQAELQRHRDHLEQLVKERTEALQQSHNQLQKKHRTLKHLLESSDHERQTIAYEIHDELAQQLAAAIMQFETFNNLKEKKPKLAAKAFEMGLTSLQQGHFEARRLVAGVRPPILDEDGILAAISHLVNESRPLNGPKIEYHSRVDFDRLVPVLENAIYRIVQEGLANACQHSKSEKVQVSMVQKKDWVQIKIWDWGVGFDPKTIRENHFGLEGIRQRARLLGGKCSIRSKIGKGTRITVELPAVLRD